MKKLLPISFFLLVPLLGFSQYELGIKVEPGMSMIRIQPGGDLEPYGKFYYSGNAGLYYKYRIDYGSELVTELKYFNISGRELVEANLTENGEKVGKVDITKKRRISFVGLSLYHEFRVDKLSLDLGYRLAIPISSEYQQEGTYDYKGTTTSQDTSYTGMDISFDHGPKAGISYDLSKRWSIDVTYYHGIRNILDTDIESDETEWKTRQLTLGIHYTFWGKEVGTWK